MADRFYRTKRPADDVEITTLGFKKGILGPLQKADITHVGDLRRWGPVAVSQINGIGQLRLSMISTAIVEWNVKTIESPHPPPQ